MGKNKREARLQISDRMKPLYIILGKSSKSYLKNCTIQLGTNQASAQEICVWKYRKNFQRTAVRQDGKALNQCGFYR